MSETVQNRNLTYYERQNIRAIFRGGSIHFHMG